MKKILFVPLAKNQTVFYEALAEELKPLGFDCEFLCYHERSHHELLKKGFKSYNAFETPAPKGADIESKFLSLVKKFDLPSDYHLLTHEQVSYGINNQSLIMAKYVRYMTAVEKVLNQNFQENKPIVIQELGGFASVIATYYVSRNLGCDHYFIEPSYFRGRFFLMKNSFGPVDVRVRAAEARHEVVTALENAQTQKQIVIPFKDRAHYYSLFNKVFNKHNFLRFYQKIYDKYVLQYEEEFSYIFNFTRRHLLSFVNKRILKSHYVPGLEKKPFIYFPLHVPIDVAITFRSPVFKDQLALIDYICRAAPLGYDVYFKEHPAMVGVLPAKKVEELLKRYQNLKILAPEINNYDVLSKAEVIVTVNSKSGAEGYALGKKVIVLGKAFYSNAPGFHYLADIRFLSEKIGEVISASGDSKENIQKYFSQVWNESLAGDLYLCEPSNVKKFAQGVLQILSL
jgi:hypothetical protein